MARFTSKPCPRARFPTWPFALVGGQRPEAPGLVPGTGRGVHGHPELRAARAEAEPVPGLRGEQKETWRLGVFGPKHGPTYVFSNWWWSHSQNGTFLDQPDQNFPLSRGGAGAGSLARSSRFERLEYGCGLS